MEETNVDSNKKQKTEAKNEKSPKKRTTAAERLEKEARRFVEGDGVGPIKRTLTDYLWDKKSGPGPREKGKGESQDDEDKEMEDVEKDETSAKKTKKGKKRKADAPPSDDKEEADSDEGKDDGPTPNQFYSRYAGQQEIPGAIKDRFGNARGNEYDLIKDRAMGGMTIVVIHANSFSFDKPLNALKEKGYKVILHQDSKVISPTQLRKELATANQLWIISTGTNRLNAKHASCIKEFFESGHGVFLWGDNIPLYEEANFIGKELFGATMSGNDDAQKTLQQTDVKGNPGFLPHLITTGIKNLYEGHTIATIDPGEHLQPLMWGTARKSDSNLICAYYDKDGKRAMMDGGFTRLWYTWDEAGSGRFVKNAAGWLSNLESKLKRMNK